MGKLGWVCGDAVELRQKDQALQAKIYKWWWRYVACSHDCQMGTSLHHARLALRLPTFPGGYHESLAILVSTGPPMRLQPCRTNILEPVPNPHSILKIASTRDHGMTAMRWLGLTLCAGLLAACAGGPLRRVSEPAASIQQLSVRGDGSWSVELRIENFSSIPMRFEAFSLPLVMGGEVAGTLQGQAGISIGPESADVVTFTHAPTSGARIAIADALAGNRSLAYSFEGTVQATPEDGRSKSFELKRSSALSPVPGLPGVLR